MTNTAADDDAPLSRTICPRCIGDRDLKRFIRNNAIASACSFCGRQGGGKLIAADVDELVDHMAACLSTEYEDAAEQVPYESREGGYQARTMDAEDLLYEEGLEPVNEAAFEYIARHLPDIPWVQRDFFRLTPYDVLRFGWSSFTEAVKHQTRYLFFPKPRPDSSDSDESIRPESMLRALGHLIRSVGLVRTLRPGTELFRIRTYTRGERPTSMHELGPPPAGCARYSNRMSPAGISMLYTAEDLATAMAEVLKPAEASEPIAVARLRLTSAVRVVDFVKLPRRPTIFTPGFTRDELAALMFVHAFARDLSQPVEKDGREHVDYVPTQVVTEYIRFRFRTRAGPVQGIRYRSAQRPGGRNVALFLGYDDFNPTIWSPPTRLPLELVSVDYREGGPNT